jgi:hypothetical protein
MAYDRIQQAAFIPSPDCRGLSASYHALTFPQSWVDDVLRLHKEGKKNPDRLTYVPIGRLNSAIGTLAPDLISVATRATFDDTPWLYAETPFPQEATDALVQAWLKDLQPAPEAHRTVRDTWQQLETRSLRWEPVTVDLLEQMISAGGTAMPSRRLYRLLTDVLAARIENTQTPYEYCGAQIAFRRIASPASASHAELISYPPLSYETQAAKTHPPRSWRYSAYMALRS